MNTIEQAREVAERLRNHDTCISDKKAADTIDALITKLKVEREDNELHQARAYKAEAELAALKAQKPVAWALPEITQQHNGQIVKHTAFHGYSVKLYLAAGAQPYDQQALEPCEACGWKAIIPGERCLVCERNDALAAGAQSIPSGYQLVPVEPTPAMVSAYLEANKAYWERTDELPKPPHKWRLGTPFDATINSYKAMLTAAPVQAGAQEQPTFRDPRTVESAQDPFAGAGKPIQERIPENCGTGHCSCISCAKTCQWTPTDDEDMPGTYDTSCGEIWRFVEGGPVENNYRFCHGCGKPVEVRP